jgi:hypothetical protein
VQVGNVRQKGEEKEIEEVEIGKLGKGRETMAEKGRRYDLSGNQFLLWFIERNLHQELVVTHLLAKIGAEIYVCQNEGI